MSRKIALFAPAVALSLLAAGLAQSQSPTATPTPTPTQTPSPDTHRHRHGGGLFENADTNHDGYVSRDEFIAARTAQFAKMDRNHDGFFDAQDLPERARERPGATERVAALIQQFDTNHDGKLSAEEFAQGALPMFDKADTDGNGSLDKKEIEAAREQARAKFRELHPRPQ